ncbi:MAG: hypothetical protein JW929_01175 [Anaerolineales bacterium]|nr:hypothetical protein [Anaerolineales bacterium]
MLFSKSDLPALTRTPQAGLCVSMFAPTHRFGRQKEQDPIRLRNLIRSAERKLRSEGMRPSDAAETLDPAREMIRTPGFWRHQNDGLAIFLSPAVRRVYRLPIRPPRTLAVGRRFHIRPLLPLLYEDGQFCLLTLSRNGGRFFWGNRDGLSPLAGDSIPGSPPDALSSDGSGKQIQWHTRTGDLGGRGRRAAVFHGQGGGMEQRKDDLLRFFRRMDRGLIPLLRGSRLPLVVAGVDYLLPIYRKANTYPHLTAVLPVGNPDRISDRRLHLLAWEAVRPVFTRRRREAFLAYRRLAAAGDPRACADLPAVLTAAFQGRVETLFMDAQGQEWGVFDAGTGKYTLFSGREEGAEDLLELAAVQVCLKGGQVFAVARAQIPAGSKIAALLSG